MKDMHFNSKIAQRRLSDLGRGACLHADHAWRIPLAL